ncbi:TnsD family Tn7-like transposition protein [Pseudomonas putida]|uniref:TnsD family Tn7-like transposition protein n=1 Tax=Pseudomonas putida TaxID=303 RepID=UPI0021564E87|nr:TnsD family Tn7-like transposition protein [Pseudomonas putida]
MASFFKALPAAWEYSVLREAPAGSPATWVTKLLRKPRCTHHPLKYIVLSTALEDDLACIPRHEEPSPPVGKRATLIDIHSSPPGPREIIPEGWKGLPAAVCRLAFAGQEARLIGDTLGVSLAYVYRTIRAVHCGPSAWRDARFLRERRQRRTAFENDYRHLHAHQCRNYAWLYRCDRIWLTDRTANGGSVHASRADSAGAFAVLDSQLAEQVRDCAQWLRGVDGRPVRITRTRIGRELHVLSRFQKQLAKLPLCARALEEVCEPAEQFHLRRLLWAKAKWEGEQRRVTRSALYRTACIRSGV